MICANKSINSSGKVAEHVKTIFAVYNKYVFNHVVSVAQTRVLQFEPEV